MYYFEEKTVAFDMRIRITREKLDVTHLGVK